MNMTEHYQIQEYSQTAAAIAILRQKYGNVAQGWRSMEKRS